LFVILAAIIRDVKAAAFENQTGARADGAFHFSFTPPFLSAGILGAELQRLGRDRLKNIKLVAALFTDVLICWHNQKTLIQEMI
jgi:hypothetical protein